MRATQKSQVTFLKFQMTFHLENMTGTQHHKVTSESHRRKSTAVPISMHR